MSRLQSQRCYLETIKLVVNHDLKDDLLLNYGAFLKQLSKNLNGQLASNNVPNGTIPEVARVIISNKELNISFGLNRVEFNIVGSRKHVGRPSLESTFKFKINECIGILDSYFRLDNFKEEFVGILGPVKYPQDLIIPKEELIDELSQTYGKKLKAGKKIITFSSKIGMLSDSHNEFINFEISNYEVKNIQITALHQGKVIDLDQFPTVEHGVQIIVDVNNRPTVEKNDLKNSIDIVVGRFFEAIEKPDLYM